VPPDASTKAPRRSRSAPVNAPRTWPNRCESISASGIAEQSTTTNGRDARDEWSWTARAASSLPVPDSPSMSTVASVGAASSSTANSSRIAIDAPAIAPKRWRSLGGTRGASAAPIRTVTLPKRRIAPDGTVTSPILEPCHQVPLVEPRSLTRTPSGVAAISA
jgi:hypothetical protein